MAELNGPRAAADQIRLHVLLARAGAGSRRAMEAAILAGRVRVNGVRVLTGRMVNPRIDLIELDGQTVGGRPARPVYLLLNKPRGVITTARDERGRETVLDLVDCPERVFPVGRLDRQSEGLVLLTNDGPLANRLTHPRYQHLRRYQVTVSGTLRPGDLYRLRSGIVIGDRRTLPAEVRVRARSTSHTDLDMVLREGRNRQIRRMLESCGKRILHLRRVGLAGLTLEGLGSGHFRYLTRRERTGLLRIVGLDWFPNRHHPA